MDEPTRVRAWGALRTCASTCSSALTKRGGNATGCVWYDTRDIARPVYKRSVAAGAKVESASAGGAPSSSTFPPGRLKHLPRA